ncbi:solute carrier family 46 member 3-like [Mya arenaria]|uniref:solute carrier family 46 member 3-like n=1 Tax=Mya arenaria TaxID=6604 RepID=UPI0022E153B8|nr:solute carrier family 46 member 3-like [Mya arenaria]
MSYTDYDDFHGRKGSIGAHIDYDTVSIPGSLVERQQKRPYEGPDESLPDLVGSNVTDTVYLVNSSDFVHTWRKWLVGPFCFLYMAAFVTSYSTFIQYTYFKVQKDLYPNITQMNETGACDDVNKSSPDYQRQVKVQAQSSDWNTYTSLAVGIPAIFANIILGSCTDKFGRKFLFFLPCVGTLIRMTVTFVGIYLNINLEYFLIGYIIEGCTGQMFTMLLVSFTYVADITPQKGKQRSFGITMIELAIGIAVAGFSFSTGYFIQNCGFYYPILSAVIMMAINLLLVFLIPESFPPSKRNTGESTLQTLKTAYDLFIGSFNRGRRWMYNLILVVFMLCMFSVFGRGSVEPLYQLGEPFCWSPEKLGRFSAVRSLLQQICGMGLIKVFQKFMSDESIAMFGSCSFIAGYVIEGFAKTDLVMYIAPVVAACGLLTVPMCRALLSKLTRSDQQGAVFAAIAAVEATVNLGGSVIANAIYACTLSFNRGIIFFVFSACNAVGFLLLWIYKSGSLKRKTLEIR